MTLSTPSSRISQPGCKASRFRITPKSLALPPFPGYCKGMAGLKLQVPVTDKVDVDVATLAAIDRGIKDADEGRTVPIDEVRKMIPNWISKSNHSSRARGF